MCALPPDVTTASIGDVESFYDSQGNLQVEKVKALSRTYAQAICGEPTQMRFNETTGAFTLSYRYNANIPANKPTVIYLNREWYYPQGVQVYTAPGTLPWRFQGTSAPDANYLDVSHPASLPSGTLVSIQIFPA